MKAATVCVANQITPVDFIPALHCGATRRIFLQGGKRMYRNKWMYTIALMLMTLLVVALWLGAYHDFTTPTPGYSWVSGGKYGPQAVTSYSIYFVTAVVTFVWIGGLCTVVNLWRGSSAKR